MWVCNAFWVMLGKNMELLMGSFLECFLALWLEQLKYLDTVDMRRKWIKLCALHSLLQLFYPSMCMKGVTCQRSCFPSSRCSLRWLTPSRLLQKNITCLPAKSSCKNLWCISSASHNLQGEVATVLHAGKHAAFFLGKYKCDEQASMTQVTCWLSSHTGFTS